MAVDWRDTLKTLLAQFEARAARSPGLNHLFVETADDEHDKLAGPSWFDGPDKTPEFVDGRPIYKKWDMSSGGTLPLVHPRYRKVEPQEPVDKIDSDLLVTDLSGVAHAVAEPMRVRFGYYCGPGGDEEEGFKSLANAAAAALAGATDLDRHAFASDLIDLFRTPRSGVRYVFGEVVAPPKQFVADGWNAGCLQYQHGVLIDVPISESSPDANHWILLLHRLGWRHITGSGLRADRFAWDGNTELKLSKFPSNKVAYPEQFAKRFEGISLDSFYSILGNKDSPLDLHLASVFAIQILLAELSSASSTNPVESDDQAAYSKQPWACLNVPGIQEGNVGDLDIAQRPQIGILVATDTERLAVLKRIRPLPTCAKVLQIFSKGNTFYVGLLGANEIVLCMSAMGSLGRDAALVVTGEMIDTWDLVAVVMVGIAFGKDSVKQQIGNVLISEEVIPYERERIGTAGNVYRGSNTRAGQVLLNRFRNVLGWDFRGPNGRQCGVQTGPILSGEKLVDDPEFKRRLFEQHPNAIGGEMEGAGVAAAAERKRCEWIVVKAICDWGDGAKKDSHQDFAAASSIDLVAHVLNQVGVLDALLDESVRLRSKRAH